MGLVFLNSSHLCATALDQLGDLDPTMGIQNSGESFLLIIVLASRGKYARNLCKHTDRVYRVDIRDDVAVRMFILEQEGTNVRLTTFHHFLDSSYDFRVAHDDGLVETGEQGTTSDRESEDLRVDFRNGLFRDGTRRRWRRWGFWGWCGG